MFGHCSSCGTYAEVDMLPVPNGAQRLLCSACSDGWGPPRIPSPDQFRVLVGRLREGSIAPAEERDLRFALDEIIERSGGKSEAAQLLLDQLMSESMMNPARARNPRWGGPVDGP